jgi:hypothetical protein
MRALRSLPPWLRRGLEAGLIAGLVSIITLLGATTASAAGQIALPSGPTGSLLLAPSVLSMGVITVGYPVAYAATRWDALLGAIAAFLIAALASAVAVTTLANMATFGRSMALGTLAGLLAVAPMAIGLIAGQLLTPLGFGRRAGAASTVTASVVALIVLILASRLG